jgi:hypothetical protein
LLDDPTDELETVRWGGPKAESFDGIVAASS